MSAATGWRRLLGGRGPLVAVLVAAALALLAFFMRQSASDSRARAEKNLAAVEAKVALAARTGDLDAATASIDDVKAKIDDAKAAGPALATAASGYRQVLGNGLATIDQLLGTARQMAAVRAQQLAVAAAGDYATFNVLQAQYADLSAAWTTGRAAFASALSSMPSVRYDELTSKLPGGAAAPAALEAPTVMVLNPPTGPAVVTGSLPAVIPCSTYSTGCQWNWEITWTESNMLPATIHRMGRRYIDLSGNVWISEYGEWFDETVSIPAGGTGTWSSFVRTTPEEAPNLDGGTMIVEWEGVDSLGNAFSGSASATLQPRAQADAS